MLTVKKIKVKSIYLFMVPFLAVLSLGLIFFVGNGAAISENDNYFYYSYQDIRGICVTDANSCSGSPTDLGGASKKTIYRKDSGKPTATSTSFSGGSSIEAATITVQDCSPTQGSVRKDVGGGQFSVTISGSASSVGIECGGSSGGNLPETEQQRIIDVRVITTIDPSEFGRVVGPVTVQLKQGDTVVQEIEIPAKEINSNSDSLEGSFRNVDPGDYTVVALGLEGSESSKQVQKVARQRALVELNGAATEDILNDNTTSGDDNSCESKGGALGWMICPVIKTVGNALDWVDDQMVEVLRLDQDRYDNDGLRQAGGVFRNFAFSLLIPIMLVMVIATALGFDFISAYTVKTALPRMVIAVIFIAISFDLMVFVVDFVQVVGDGIQNIILAPFETPGGEAMTSTTKLSDLIAINNTGDALEVAGANAGIAGALLAAAFGGLAGASLPGAFFAILGFVGTAFIIMLSVFVLLLFRQTMIVLLLLVAPLAILPWIFPGRDKLFSLWSKTFWLMVWFYPVIMVAIGVGKAMAAILLS